MFKLYLLKIIYSPLLDLEIELLTLRMTFLHQNSFRKRLLGKKSHQKTHITFLPILFLEDHIFTFFALEMTLRP